MTVDQNEANAVNKILWPSEVVEETVAQRRVGPGGDIINPTSVIATNMRIIIINKTTLGLRRDYEVIPYKQITTVRLEHGLISSTVFIRVQGYDTDRGLLKNGDQEGEIDGLKNNDAQELSDYINKKITGVAQMLPAQPDNSLGAYVYCSNCGAKHPATAKFCSKCGASLEK